MASLARRKDESGRGSKGASAAVGALSDGGSRWGEAVPAGGGEERRSRRSGSAFEDWGEHTVREPRAPGAPRQEREPRGDLAWPARGKARPLDGVCGYHQGPRRGRRPSDSSRRCRAGPAGRYRWRAAASANGKLHDRRERAVGARGGTGCTRPRAAPCVAILDRAFCVRVDASLDGDQTRGEVEVGRARGDTFTNGGPGVGTRDDLRANRQMPDFAGGSLRRVSDECQAQTKVLAERYDPGGLPPTGVEHVRYGEGHQRNNYLYFARHGPGSTGDGRLAAVHGRDRFEGRWVQSGALRDYREQSLRNGVCSANLRGKVRPGPVLRNLPTVRVKPEIL